MTIEKILPFANFAYIVLVAIGALSISHLTSLVNKSKDRELARFQTDAELQIQQAETRAAEANALAKQAQLELAKLKQPRSISPEHQERIIQSMSQFAGQTYAFMAHEDSESYALMEQIDSILQRAGWVLIPQWMSDIEKHIGNKVVGDSAKSGVYPLVGPNYRKGEQIATLLGQMLGDAGIDSTPSRDANWGDKNPEALLIEVGGKPLH